jgi:hypothetical protein
VRVLEKPLDPSAVSARIEAFLASHASPEEVTLR